MEFLKSKKFLTAIGALIVVIVAKFIPGLESVVNEVVAIAIAYIVGTGLADVGKSAKLIDGK